MSLQGKNILLVVSGGIAAYKSLELIRLLRKSGATINTILTAGGAQFVTPLSISALSENPVYTDLFSLKDESEMGHIRLSRNADLIVVAPASANTMAKLAQGLAEDLASTTLLAANKKILMAPAMNHMMWNYKATQDNITELANRGVEFIGPVEGDMACGEFGMGRMVEPETILVAIQNYFSEKPLTGFKAVITAGPTYEPIDPVRFIGNRSSGKQGYAIAQALADEGADVTLISGPTSLSSPANVKLIKIETADEMYQATINSLPSDIAVCTAAVSDWKAENATDQKMKKRSSGETPTLKLTENPDILKTISTHKHRPRLVVGFAAETQNTLENAMEKLKSKGCDWIIANQVGEKSNPVFGSNENEVILVSSAQSEPWPRLSKQAVAHRLVQKIISHMKDQTSDQSSRKARS